MPFSLFTATCTSCRLPQRQSFFISWTQYPAKRHKWSFVSYIASFSGLKMVFSKLSQLDMTVCIKTVYYADFNLRYFMSSVIKRLIQIFLSNKFFCTNLAWFRNSSIIFGSSHRRYSMNKLFLKILWYSQENTCVWVSFLLKLQAFRPLNILEMDFNTDIFLWISGNLQEHLFWRTFANGCFCIFGNFCKA